MDCIEIEPSTRANHSIIWLHGLGADGNDFAPIVTELALPSPTALRFIFPHAPALPITINNGYVMRAWYDIYGADIGAKIDKSGIAQSVSRIEALVAKEVDRGIAPEHIFLAGFSQGAVIALTTGLCYPQRLAGIIALSGYLPLTHEVLQKATAANRPVPIFLAHGTQDLVVPYLAGKAAETALSQAGYAITWQHYAMPHSVCEEEIHDLKRWLQAVTAAELNKTRAPSDKQK